MKINAANAVTNSQDFPPSVQEWVAAAMHVVHVTANLTVQRQEQSPPPTCYSAGSKLAYTVDEAAEALSISRTLLFDLMRRGEIASVKLGRRALIPALVLYAYLARLVVDHS